MIKTRYQIRQLLLTLLIILVSVILGLSLYYVIDDHIKLINTWQYNATYDFEKEIETTQDGKNTLVCKVDSAEQLAGAFAISTTQIGLDGPAGFGGSGGSLGGDDKTDYKEISSKIDKTLIRLTSSIDLSERKWEPKDLGSGVTFDGNGFCIKNLTIESSNSTLGFIMKNEGTIKNLVFINASVINTDTTQKSTSNGVVVGENKGVVENVTVVSGSVYANADGEQNKDRRAGGIVGLNNSENAILRYCSNYATIGRAKFAGGIVGFQGNGLIEYCYNYGNISCSCNIYPRMGGICAEVKEGTVQYCINSGEIKDIESKVSKDFRAGGIIGMQLANVTVQYCGNVGDVKVGHKDANVVYAGGIVGYSEAQISNCYNHGEIYSEAKESADSPVTYGERLIYEKWIDCEYFDYYIDKQGFDHNICICEAYEGASTSKSEAYSGGIAGKGTSINNCYSTNSQITGGYESKNLVLNVLTQSNRGYYRGWNKDVTWYNEKFISTLKVNSIPYSHQICPNIDNKSVQSCIYEKNQDSVAMKEFFKKNTSHNLEYIKGSGIGLESNNSQTLILYNPQTVELSSSTSDNSKVVEIKYNTVNIVVTFYCDTENNTMGIKLGTFCGAYERVYSEEIKSNENTGDKVNNLKSSDSLSILGEDWVINSGKNNGYPYLKNMYW